MSEAMRAGIGAAADGPDAVRGEAEQEARKLRHDIKGCLNALRLGAAILDRATLASDKVDSLECISSAADELNELLDKLGVEYLPPVAAVVSVPNAA